MVLDKFIPPYIKFIESFISKNHLFIIFADDNLLKEYPLNAQSNIILINQMFKNKVLRYAYIGYKIQKSYKSFIHGLWNEKINVLLSLMPWVLKKCTWAIWGGDLYYHIFNTNDRDYKIKEFFRKRVIKRFGSIIPVVYGDYYLARKWYKARAKMLEPFMYVQFYERYMEIPLKEQGDIINIQIGNSATQTNHHIDCINLIKKYSNIKTFIPLSYGDLEYAKEVEIYAKEHLDDVVILESFMPFNEYMQMLACIDIAIFNQNRQQGMGNIFVLLALGKKIYLRSDTTHYDFLVQKGFKIFDISEFSISPILKSDAMHNKNLVLKLYSKEKQIIHQKELYN